MIRFESLENLGVRVAAMSERADGDCYVERTEDGLFPSEALASVLRACDLDLNRCSALRQIHGAEVVPANEATRPIEADGLVAQAGEGPLCISAADCVPVYLYDPIRKAGALLHGGRKGTFENISAKGVARLQKEYRSEPGDLWAVLAPSAGPCCYEVSEELAAEFEARNLPVIGRHLDLWSANRRQLRAAGVPDSQIETSEICTICDGRFHSHRRYRDGQRNMAVLAP